MLQIALCVHPERRGATRATDPHRSHSPVTGYSPVAARRPPVTGYPAVTVRDHGGLPMRILNVHSVPPVMMSPPGDSPP